MSEINTFNAASNIDATKILQAAQKLQDLSSIHGINAFQPGAMKELKMASILQHCWITNKKEADACNPNDPKELYEYLSACEGKAGQIDRVQKDDPNDSEQHNKHLASMERVHRNKWFFLAYTNKDTSKPLDILRIYRVSPESIAEEMERQLSKSTNIISHVSFDEKFAITNGELVWSKSSDK